MTSRDTHWIVGPGALGRLIGLRLATRPGPPVAVTLIGRRRLPVEQTLITPQGEAQRANVATATLGSLPAAPPAVVHLTTKAYGAEAAYAALAPHLPAGTPLVLWQNGFGCQPRLSRRHDGPVLCATTTEGAYLEAGLASDSRVVHAGRGETLIGALDDTLAGRQAKLARALAGELATTLIDAGLASRAVDDIRQRLWQKLAVNAAINPLVARFRIRNGQLRDRPFRTMVKAIITEVAAILAAEGIAPPGSAGLMMTGGDEHARHVEAWRAMVWRVVEGTAGNRASMLQDVLAGRPTEHEAILGPLLAAADAHDLAAPRLAELAAWLRAREVAGSSDTC
ncbi:MAG: 2-dehydropantoate 2-reductase [Halomonas sp.]|uniref:ketopantoate reductase family protein n=1 Tax=Halomonas sp. TaxID=1486246 RepID=UPI0019F303D2|nr:2-dehydropantoate 2-reductase [Halomonas sp.]MBE0489250.1 2-dehydropantoate 2-reductase [Halomonas sp.]